MNAGFRPPPRIAKLADGCEILSALDRDDPVAVPLPRRLPCRVRDEPDPCFPAAELVALELDAVPDRAIYLDVSAHAAIRSKASRFTAIMQSMACGSPYRFTRSM